MYPEALCIFVLKEIKQDVKCFFCLFMKKHKNSKIKENNEQKPVQHLSHGS